MESFTILPEEDGIRSDLLLAKRFTSFSRTYFQFLIEQECVLVAGKPVKKREKLKAGDLIKIFFKDLPAPTIEPEKIELNILYEDEHLLAINKPSGMVTHPAVGNWSGTFVNALLYYCEELNTGSDPIRPGIVHRLDKETTGVLIAAKTINAHQKLIEAFAGRKMKKTYLAICLGKPKEGRLITNIGRHPIKRKEMAVLKENGKEAITDVTILKYNEHFSLVEVQPKTGRTHQIRVHMKALGCPILGDLIYGRKKADRLFLHAHRLSFDHPITNQPIEIVAPIPEDFQGWISKLE